MEGSLFFEKWPFWKDIRGGESTRRGCSALMSVRGLAVAICFMAISAGPGRHAVNDCLLTRFLQQSIDVLIFIFFIHS